MGVFRQPTSAPCAAPTHQLKTHHHWQTTRSPDDTDQWTTPNGLHHPVPEPPSTPDTPTTPTTPASRA